MAIIIDSVFFTTYTAEMMQFPVTKIYPTKSKAKSLNPATTEAPIYKTLESTKYFSIFLIFFFLFLTINTTVKNVSSGIGLWKKIKSPKETIAVVKFLKMVTIGTDNSLRLKILETCDNLQNKIVTYE